MGNLIRNSLLKNDPFAKWSAKGKPFYVFYCYPDANNIRVYDQVFDDNRAAKNIKKMKEYERIAYITTIHPDALVEFQVKTKENMAFKTWDWKEII